MSARTKHDKFRDEFLAKQEANKAAELKAQLEMVETRAKRSYTRRQHRKIGEMVCDTGVKTGHRNATASFVLRLNSTTGEFIAEHGDVEYVSKSRDALKIKMDQVAKVTLDLKWTRYLLVDYEAVVEHDRYRGTTTLQLDAPRKKEMPVLGIKLEWSVVEYSDAIELPDLGPRFMKRGVDEKGEADDAQETVPELPDGLVPYTKEREGVLKRLREAIGQVDARMVELFRGVPVAVGRQLDQLDQLGVDGARLLEAPRKPKG